MMRRLFWFVLGAATALFAASWFKKKAADLGERMTPENLARSVVEHAVSVGRRVGEVSSEAWRSARSSRDGEADPGRPTGA
jgi:hypothetical protein